MKITRSAVKRLAQACALVGVVAGTWSAGGLAHADSGVDYPKKSMHLLVPFPPGGSTDAAARIVGAGLGQAVGQSVVVENKAGAAGVIGVNTLARAKPDGYTLGVGPVGATIVAKLIGMQVSYDPEADIDPVAFMGGMPMVLAVSADVPANSVSELLTLVKEKPGSFSYGSSGTGTPGHVAFEYIKSLVGADIVHVPYKGDAPLIVDLIGGQLELGVLTGPGALTQKDNDKIKFLAVTSAERYPQLPSVPTLQESGEVDLAVEIWNMLIVPQATPESVKDKLNTEMNVLLETASLQEQFLNQGFLKTKAMSRAEVRDYVAQDRAKWRLMVDTTGVKLD